MSGFTLLLKGSPQVYEKPRDVLNHDNIPLCLNSTLLVRSGSEDHKRFIKEAVIVLGGILPAATIQREIPSIMKQPITSPTLKHFPKDQHDVITKPC